MHTPQPPLAGKRLISRAELREFVSVSDMALWRWIKFGKIPPPIYIGRRRYWRQSDLESWLNSKSGTSSSLKSPATWPEPWPR